LVLLCLDEMIDDGCIWPPFVSWLFLLSCFLQHNRWHRLVCHCLEGQSTATWYNRDCHQWADYNECIPDCEGENAAKDGTTVVRLYILL
jgi:hypothetical protein